MTCSLEVDGHDPATCPDCQPDDPRPNRGGRHRRDLTSAELMARALHGLGERSGGAHRTIGHALVDAARENA